MKRTLFSILLIAAILIIAGVSFYMITTTMSSPTSMELYMPKDEKANDEYPGISSKLTVVLLKNDRVYGYFGHDASAGRSMDLKEVRNLIREGINKFSKDSLVVIIKPGKEATYKNTVDILDEMTVNDIKRYAMDDLSEQEKELLVKADH